MAAVVAGPADLRRWSENFASVPDFAVLLPQVHPVRAKALGQTDAVVDDEGGLVVRADALQRLGQTGEFMCVDIFHTQLERRDRSCGQCRLQAVGEFPSNLL